MQDKQPKFADDKFAWQEGNLEILPDDYDIKALKALDPRTSAELRLQRALEEAFGKLQADIALRIYHGQPVDYNELTNAFRGILEAELVEIVTEEGIRLGTTIGFDPAAINAQAVDWARSYSFELVKELTETSREVISRSIQSFFSTPGMTRGDLTKLLDPAFGRVRAEMIAVTETTRAFSQAQNAYQRQLSDEGVEMERVWRTSNDELVCPICAPLNGLPEEDWKGTYPEGPAAHPRCRCSMTLRVPETKFNPYHDERGRFASGASGAMPAPPRVGETTVEAYWRQEAERLGAGQPAVPSSGVSELLGDKLTMRDNGALAQEHLAELAMMPESVLADLAKRGVKWDVASDIGMTQLDSNQHLQGVTPRGWPPSATWDEVPGGWSPRSRYVTAGNGRHGTASLILHETGHAYGQFSGLASSKAMTAHHKRLWPKLDPYLQQGGPGGRAGMEEMFAEITAIRLKRGRRAAIDWSDEDFVSWLEKGLKL